MILFPNPTNCIVHYWVGKYPDRVGALYSPFYWNTPRFYMPYAIDNGAWKEFIPEAFMGVLRACRILHKPMWVLVPDVVADAEATMRMWHEWKPIVESFGYPLAFAAQDGHEPEDVPREAFACFVGGTTRWKLENAHKFKGICEWLHIGRVSTRARLRWAKEIGANSCDGTGWFRGAMGNQDNKQFNAIMEYFEGSPQREMF